MATPEREEINKLNVKAATSSIFVASTLFFLKIFTGIITGSIAVIASALDSAFDFLSSSVNLYAVRHAQKPADSGHRYGHGKAEALAGFIQSIFIFGSVFYLVFVSIQRFINPSSVDHIVEGVSVMIISIVMTYLLTVYQKKVFKKGKSLVIAADRLHYITDILANAAVVISLAIGKYIDLPWVDPLAAILIAVFILKSSSEILKNSFDILMDKDISDKYREDIKLTLKAISPDVLGYHDLRSRSAGDIDFLEFHMEISKDMKVKDSHDLVEDAMYKLKEIHPNLEIIIHTDPAVIDETDGKVKILDKEKPRFY